MDTTNNRKALLADLLNTAAIITVLLAIFVAWRTLAGQDNGVLTLLSRLF